MAPRAPWRSQGAHNLGSRRCGAGTRAPPSHSLSRRLRARHSSPTPPAPGNQGGYGYSVAHYGTAYRSALRTTRIRRTTRICHLTCILPQPSGSRRHCSWMRPARETRGTPENGSRTLNAWSLVSGFGFRVSGFGFQVSGFGFRVSDFGFRVSGFGFRVSGFGFRVS